MCTALWPPPGGPRSSVTSTCKRNQLNEVVRYKTVGGPRSSVTSTCKHNQLNEVVQYKTVCSWSLLLLHNTVGGVCTVGGVLWVVYRGWCTVGGVL